MDTAERLDLVTRHTTEVVTEEELRTLFEETTVISVEPTRTEVTQRYSVPVYYVTATGSADDVAILGASRVDRIDLTASISPSGLVRSYTVRYSVWRNGTEYRVVESAKYTDVGATTVNATSDEQLTDTPTRTDRWLPPR